MTKKTEHWVYVNKKIDIDHELTKVAIYGSVRELFRDNDVVINNKHVSERTLRNTLKNNLDHYEDEKNCIKKCEVQRSKMKK